MFLPASGFHSPYDRLRIGEYLRDIVRSDLAVRECYRPELSGRSSLPILSHAGETMTYSTHVEVELTRATILVGKDHKQRWVTMDGAIHAEPVPYRDAISVYWCPIPQLVTYSFRIRLLAHAATM